MEAVVVPCFQSSLQHSLLNKSRKAVSLNIDLTSRAVAAFAKSRKPRHCSSMSSRPCMHCQCTALDCSCHTTLAQAQHCVSAF